ncbi:hypothetical protein GSI_10727 [Ganoderma sinense ZZ0214-1]|uniref:Uncharacterized protein n=1 Tax=Ganoderma sinense ZZ0214-1 TaxID=1077348 RepID=A0A2G8S1D1_9APHY|nr:hypothetical protein GSI_10727 [Ganoderma sinense ZZ0214-1]
MKFFNTFLATVFVALVGVVCTMAQTSDQVISAIQSFITVSSNLNAQVTPLSVTTFPTMGFVIAQGFNNITSAVNTFNADSEFSPATPAYPDDAAVAVVDVLTTFVQVHQALLNVVIGKHSLAAMFGATAPIAAALRALEAVVDTFAFDLIALIPTESDPATAQVDALSVTFTNATTTYDS